jgi:cytochrome o ubiquinol oxidase operon protein cyoD
MSYIHQDKFEFGYREKTYRSYLVGLAGSLFLTLLAFFTVYYKSYDETKTYAVISVLAIIQLVVQAVCFLRLNASPLGRWNLFPFLFVLTMIAFIAGGSLWIMYHLNHNMLGY